MQTKSLGESSLQRPKRTKTTALYCMPVRMEQRASLLRGTVAFLRVLGEVLRHADALPRDRNVAIREHLNDAVNQGVLDNAHGRSNARNGRGVCGGRDGRGDRGGW